MAIEMLMHRISLLTADSQQRTVITVKCKVLFCLRDNYPYMDTMRCTVNIAMFNSMCRIMPTVTTDRQSTKII